MIFINKPQILNINNKTRMISKITINNMEKDLFFEVENELKEYFTFEVIDSFVVLLLPYAMTLGLDICSDAPMSSRLLYNINELLIPNLVRATKRYRKINIKAPILKKNITSENFVGTGYSGGVDSLYTILSHLNLKSDTNLTHLAVFNAGAYEGENFKELYEEALKYTKKVSSTWNLNVVGVYTNIDEIVNEHYLSVVSYRLISCALALGKLWKTYLLSSSYEFESFSIDENNSAFYDLMLVELLSTEYLNFYSSGGTLKRIEKIRAIADSDENIRKQLHVCVKNPLPGSKNCGICYKCIRTILALENLGYLDKFSSVFSLTDIKKNHDEIYAKAFFTKENIHINEASIILESNKNEEVNRKLRGIKMAKKVAERHKEKIIKYSDISVVIPAYNAEKYLKEAITSIRNQIGFNCKIIVIDDGSTDNTEIIAKKLDVLFLKKEHSGAATSRNIGLKKVTTKYVFLLDADDILSENVLKDMHEILEQNNDLYAVFGLAQDFVSPELSIEEKNKIKLRDKPYGGILPGCSLFRKEVFDIVGLFDENLTSGEVVDWMIRFRNSKLKSVNIDLVTLKRRIHLDNTGRKNRKDEASNYAAILRKRIKSE